MIRIARGRSADRRVPSNTAGTLALRSPASRCSGVFVVDKTYRALLRKIAFAYGDVRASRGNRAAYALALLALADFLKTNGAGGPVLPWLAELGSALTDLDDGIVCPLLATQKRKGFPSHEWRRRALICLGMRALAERGVDRKEAAASAKRASKAARQLSVGDLVTLYDQFQKKRRHKKPRGCGDVCECGRSRRANLF
jgi:hypothetical protein